MRLAVGLFAAVLALAGCTASPLDGMNRIALTAAAEPVPSNHKDLLRHHFGLNRPRDLMISAPRPLLAATVTEPARWYVCVRARAGTESVHVISAGRLAGTIPSPAPRLCSDGSYEPLG